MTEHYVEFKTWAEGSVDCTWPLVIFGEIDDYRERRDLRIAASQNAVRGAFSSLSQERMDEFFGRYVPALLIGMVIKEENTSLIPAMINEVFGSHELLLVRKVSSENATDIMEIMKPTGYRVG